MAILFCFYFYNNWKYKLIFRDSREANISLKSVASISVPRRPWGDRPGRSPSNPTLFISSKSDAIFTPHQHGLLHTLNTLQMSVTDQSDSGSNASKCMREVPGRDSDYPD
jgi:hypothetical protein